MNTSCGKEISASPVKERRRTSQTGLLDSAIRMVAQLAASNDLNTRTLANRSMTDLQKLRHGMPKRRQVDTATRFR